MKKVLVLTDFSPPSQAGVEYAFKLATQYSLEVFVYHCMTEHTHIQVDLHNTEDYILFDIGEDRKLSALKKWKELASNVGNSATFIAAGGDLVSSTNSFCQGHGIDLVIMGSSGRSQKVDQWGSNTDRMVKDIDYPLLIVKEPLEVTNFAKVLYASSFTLKEKTSFSLMLNLIPFAKKSEIHLVSIDTESFFTQPSVLINQVMDDYVELAKPISTKKHFYQSLNVTKGITKIAEDIEPDLLVMSNKLRKPIKRILLGNDAVDIAHTSPHPVLIINYPD